MTEKKIEDLKKIISKNVKAKRKEAGITQSKLADKCGLSLTYISHVEQGLKWPSVKTVNKIARALNIPPSFILSDTESINIIQEELAAYLPKLKEADLLALKKVAKVFATKK